MSEEEKKAIEFMEEYKNVVYKIPFKTILNLIDKQQKEIEELRERLSIRKEQQETILTEKIKTLREEKIELIHNFEEGEKIFKKEIKSLLKEIEERETILQEEINENSILKTELYGNSISKDKIKEILGIEENIEEEKILSLLQTIVAEFNRLEDIEDRKVQVEYQNVFNKGVKSVEDKIREKIEKYEKLDKEEYSKQGNFETEISLLKELLEE